MDSLKKSHLKQDDSEVHINEKLSSLKKRLKKVDNIPVLLPERLSITALPLRRLINRSLQSSVHFTVLTCHQVPESMTPSVFPLGHSSIKLQPVYLIFFLYFYLTSFVKKMQE